MAKETILVVSDLHLGGPEGFQMCSPPGAARLASFFGWARDLHGRSRGVHLVLAGDVVDFLAEPDDPDAPRDRWTWAPFAADESLALAKLDRILGRTAPVWSALSEFVAATGELTVLLGNHDVELSLPAVRRRFLDAVGWRRGRVTFVYDGEAFTRGDVLVEHGNRYEGWNVVDYDGLRGLRSALSRGEDPPSFAPQPGSRLVAEVMNRIKASYAFVDLLKPETGAVLPILAVLDPAAWKGAGRAVATCARAAWRDEQVGPEGPSTGAFRGARAAGAPSIAPFPDEDVIAVAEELASQAEGVPATRGATRGVRELESRLLLRAFRARRSKDALELEVASEADPYRGAAAALARRGHRVVVFGHTHFAKRVPLDDGPSPATYLNAGTWADLMRLPAAIYEGDDDAGVRALDRFVEALRSNDVAAYRRQVPTFARIELEDGTALSSDVYIYRDGAEPQPITTERLEQLLAPADPSAS